MSRSGRPGDGGGRRAADALRDPNVTHLMHVCGKHIDLVVEVALQSLYSIDKRESFLGDQMCEQSRNSVCLWNRPLDAALQSRYADCRCSAMGRLVRRNNVTSGSVAEGLYSPPTPPKFQTTSDVDVMYELGPVHWASPNTETSPVEVAAEGPTTATTANPRGQKSDLTPRLVIVETDVPGFVLVLQERRDDCPHRERRPFKAEDVIQSFRDYLQVTTGEGVTQTTHGPACPFVQTKSEVFEPSDYDYVPCLHVPVWWFSDEFFSRHRRYNWPPKAMLDDIKLYGLHLVPVGAPGSDTEKLEWRLSFSRAEVVIASHLTDLQGCAAITFKICKTALGEDGKMIKSNFIKTALFWLCEQTPVEEWKSVTQGLLKLLDFLDHAVSTGYLPCFFWSRINLLRSASRADRKAMKKALKTIRQQHVRLLTHGACMLYPDLPEMLTQLQVRRPSERQLRVCLTRWLIAIGVICSIRGHMSLSITTRRNELLPVLLRSYTPAEVMSLFFMYRHWCDVQTALYRALTVAPEDVKSQVHFSASGDGFVWDAAPLLELLTEDDLKRLLGDPDAVRSWLRRHHQLPETGRPAGTLPADLMSPRDLCDLLLNIPLLVWVLGKSVPNKWTEYQKNAARMSARTKRRVVSTEQARQEKLQLSAHWRELADGLHTTLGMDHEAALRMACRLSVELRQLCDDPETLEEHNRIRDTLPDPWQLKQFKLGSP